jgi:chromosome segregation ATPase
MGTVKGIFQWVNPLYYPLPIFMGCVVLALGVRVVKAPSIVVVPIAIAVSTLAAGARAPKAARAQSASNPALVQELAAIQQQAKTLARKAQDIEGEAKQCLGEPGFVDLLGTVQYACDRTRELPAKIDRLAQRLQGEDSILSVAELQGQLQEVQKKLSASSGVAQTQLSKLAESLRRNIQLAQQGQDARQAQVVSLSTLILDSVGVLQTMQNQLRTLDLGDVAQTAELQNLGNELREFQENLDLVVLR